MVKTRGGKQTVVGKSPAKADGTTKDMTVSSPSPVKKATPGMTTPQLTATPMTTTKTPTPIKQEKSVVLRPSESGDWSGGEGIIPGRAWLGPLFLMITTPCFSMVYYHVVTQMRGDFVAFARLCVDEGFFNVLYYIWPDAFDGETWKMIGSFLVFELVLQRWWPGKLCKATMTPKGHIPVYKANGMQAYFVTLITLMTLAHFQIIRPARVYEKFGNILASMNVFAWVFCTMLLIKGYVKPSTADSGTTGSWIYDFFWGLDLYPNILGWDVKMFTNCRAGMMFWVVGILCFAYKNQELHGGQLQLGMAVNVALQMIYLTKFYYWEMGYMCSMDIQHDRAGYYLCWGCLVWVPAVYTSHSFYLVEHCPEWSPLGALTLFLCGLFCVFINYDSDNQRYVFRQANGKCLIWGKEPKYIVAEFNTTNALTGATQTKQSLLLVDGWWRISRHFHYCPEILASLCWSLPAWDTGMVGPYFYVVYLTILLTDRAYRDDDRCQKKYGKYWTDYRENVPYKIIPGII
jgi:7-dehydrocholesterol reductase